MKILELFAGSRSIGKVAEERGHEVFSVDIQKFEGIPFSPDMIWASPPCTTYSIAAISHHRPTRKPLSHFAYKSDKLVKNTLRIIDYYKCIYYIENPRGLLRKQHFMLGLPSVTVWYCTYGDTSAKPTDIWSNNIRNIWNVYGWQPKPQCFNGNKRCHHEPAPRGSKTGTQGKKGNYERSKIPYKLCLEIITATEKKLRYEG